MSRAWVLLLTCLITLTGYFGPWVGHAAAGLVVTGLDLGEYSKFLPAVKRGEVWLWRPGFYAPLVAVAAACVLAAYRRDLRHSSWQRVLFLLIALVGALNLLPPAWTPQRLLQPEFRWQTGAFILLLAGIGLSPFLALLPRRASALLVTGLGLAAIFFPIQGFWAVLPAIQEVMARSVNPAWGIWLMPPGLLALIIAWWLPDPIGRPHPNRTP